MSAVPGEEIGPGCDLTRVGLASLEDLSSFNDASLNILLFVPLGAAIGLLPGSRRKAAIAIAAILAPFAIELFQLLVPQLGRGCQSADVVDNLTGLVLGLAAGTAGRWLVVSSGSRV
jgi:VanZ family protein